MSSNHGQLFDHKGNKVGSFSQGAVPSETKIYDNHGTPIATAVTTGLGNGAVASAGGVLGLSCLVIGLGLIPYIGLMVSIYAAIKMINSGWKSVSKGMKIFCTITAIGWTVWSLWAIYYAQKIVHADWGGIIDFLILLALLTQIPSLFIYWISYQKNKLNTN
jgi:hypothetical protein